MSQLVRQDMDADEAAALWDARLRASDCSDAEREAHEEWKSAAPANARAFEGLQTMIEGLPSIASMPEIQSMRAAALTRRKQEIATEPRRFSGFMIGGAIAASLMVAIITTLLLLPTSTDPTAEQWAANEPTPVFSTSIGEQADIHLNDGTTATLNTDSKIDVRYSVDERAVHLVKGEAHFDVAHNPNRPFSVYAGDYKIIAVGTAFDVKAMGDKVDVTVTEGKVEVSRLHSGPTEIIQSVAMVEAGQQLSARATGPAFRRNADIAKVTSWRRGNAVFEDVPLAFAAEEMNRYSEVKLTITDPGLANTKINGMFITGRQDSFIEALEAYFNVEARRVSDTEILLEPVAR